MRDYFPGDRVIYRGTKLNDLRGRVGEVCARVQGSKYGVTVDFGDDSYVVDSRNLVTFVPSKDSGNKEPEIQVRRKRQDPDLE